MKDLKGVVTDGHEIKNMGRCHKVMLQIQKFQLHTSFYAVSLDGMSKILGAEWLMLLSDYTTNQQKKLLKFKWQGQTYKLYDEPPVTKKASSLSIWKLNSEHLLNCINQGPKKKIGTHTSIEVST